MISCIGPGVCNHQSNNRQPRHSQAAEKCVNIHNERNTDGKQPPISQGRPSRKMNSATNLKKTITTKQKQFSVFGVYWVLELGVQWGTSIKAQSRLSCDLSPHLYEEHFSTRSNPRIRVKGTWQPVPRRAHVSSPHSSDGLSLPFPHPDSPCLLFLPSRAPCPALGPSELDSCPGQTAPCSCHLWFAWAPLQNTSISQQAPRPSFF